MSRRTDDAAGATLAAVGLILDAQEPPFEGRVRGRRIRKALWSDSADELIRGGLDYFGPVGRKARQPRGSSKGNVADTTNVVWLDLDPGEGWERRGAGELAEEAGRWLEGLRALGLGPSVFVFSGRGSWAYWKLDRHVAQAEAESLMRRLMAQFRPGGSEHDVGRVARMPGSVNEKTGLVARVLAVEDSRWDPVALARLLPDDPSPGAGDGGSRAEQARPLKPAGRLPQVDLPDDLRAYMAARPTKKQRAAEGVDGSRLEQAIVARLVNARCSDEQIALFFDHHELPRHMEELGGRRGYRWLAMGIANARARMVPSPPPVSIGKGTYSAGVRGIGWYARRWVMLRDMPEGLRKLELVDWVRETFWVERSQARRDLGWLEDSGYVAAGPDAEDGRVKRVSRTQKAADRLANWKGPGVPFEFVKGLSADPAATPAPSTASRTRTEREAQPEERPTPPKPKARARAVDPEAAERRRRERSPIDDVYRIHIPGVRWTYLQLLLPLDEWAKVLLHEQLRVGIDEQGLPVHRSFISPRDPALGGPDAPDPIGERTRRDGGRPARDRRIGIAAELTPDGDGFRLATRVEDGKTLPNIGLVVQADYNFYRPLRAYRRRQDRVIAVRKRGRGKGTTFEFRLTGEGVEIPGGHGIDLDALLDELADRDEARAVLDSLPDGWRLVKRVPWG